MREDASASILRRTRSFRFIGTKDSPLAPGLRATLGEHSLALLRFEIVEGRPKGEDFADIEDFATPIRKLSRSAVM